MTMAKDRDVFTIRMRKRPWWFWGLAAAWLLLEVVLIQTALASAEEGEYRAATICWIAAGVLAGCGGIAWLHKGRPHNLGASSEQH
jgi:hypothetical protein